MRPGGKRRLAKHILPLVGTPHVCYLEPFAGAAAILFAKAPSKVEVLNDINGELVNLYRVIQYHLEEFCREFKHLLISRQIFDWLRITAPETLTGIQRAARARQAPIRAVRTARSRTASPPPWPVAIRIHGITVAITGGRGYATVVSGADHPGLDAYGWRWSGRSSGPRTIARAWLRAALAARDRQLRIGGYMLRAHRRPSSLVCGRWTLERRGHRLWTWDTRPARDHVACCIREDRAARRAAAARAAAALPDAGAHDTLGWRAWFWDEARARLVSPHQETVWDDAELIADDWDDSDALRGTCGIHARRMPRDWVAASWVAAGRGAGPTCVAHDAGGLVTGVVERYERYVLGVEGWRAERVVIRELLARTIDVYAGLLGAYPDLAGHIRLAPWAIPAGEAAITAAGARAAGGAT